ncbi:MAG: hypothetical protein K0Q63_1597 [Paenibacillus sp.]|nr:hypothetical protein [Paenibacillus sp.]
MYTVWKGHQLRAGASSRDSDLADLPLLHCDQGVAPEELSKVFNTKKASSYCLATRRSTDRCR